MLSFPTDLQMPNSYLQPSWPLICEFNIYKAVLMPWMQNLLHGISCQHISVICTQGLFFRNSKQPILINMINTLKIIAWHTTPSYYVFFLWWENDNWYLIIHERILRKSCGIVHFLLYFYKFGNLPLVSIKDIFQIALVLIFRRKEIWLKFRVKLYDEVLH